MTLEQFAKSAGVRIIKVDKAIWGGTLGYAEDKTSCVCGFSSRKAAYQHWLESTFGDKTAKAIELLLKDRSHDD